jgi:ADP-ribose pyrophosphatase YjhB (NUDIX family)
VANTGKSLVARHRNSSARFWHKGSDGVPATTLIKRALQRYWRLSRGLTVAVYACVFDSGGRVLLVHNSADGAWHFPGGGALKTEALEDALSRHLAISPGIIMDGRPQLFGLYANCGDASGDHVALYAVRAWHRAGVSNNMQSSASSSFFAVSNLPERVNPHTAQRIAEIVEGRSPAEIW